MVPKDRERVRGLIFDPFAGISGDMLLGALVDLGLPDGWLSDRVRSLDLGATVAIDRVDRSGLSCVRVRFDLPEERAHRHLADVLEIVERADVPAGARARARAVFRRLAEAEAAVHGVPVERVHFHEVGALDSILDVLCGVAAIEELGYTELYTRPVAVGSGVVEMAHGRYPLPAPATARLLAGLPVRETGYPEECTTPTGAAILAELTEGKGPPLETKYGASGFGAGTRDPAGRPNCLRLIECAAVPADGTTGADRLYRVEADIDDQSPEYLAAAREMLFDAGAVDVTLLRVDMKKGRPGVRLEALVDEESLAAVRDAVFRETTTIGLRYWPVQRAILERTEERLEWRGHEIRVKRVVLPDGRERRKPEFDDIIAAARATGRTPQEVLAELDTTARSDAPNQ